MVTYSTEYYSTRTWKWAIALRMIVLHENSLISLSEAKFCALPQRQQDTQQSVLLYTMIWTFYALVIHVSSTPSKKARQSADSIALSMSFFWSVLRLHWAVYVYASLARDSMKSSWNRHKKELQKKYCITNYIVCLHIRNH